MGILKWLLITSIGRKEKFGYAEIPRKIVEEKVEMCEDYLKALDIVDTGISHNRGITLWEKYSASMHLMNARINEGSMQKSEVKSCLKILAEDLDECEKALQFSETDEEGTSKEKISLEANL